MALISAPIISLFKRRDQTWARRAATILAIITAVIPATTAKLSGGEPGIDWARQVQLFVRNASGDRSWPAEIGIAGVAATTPAASGLTVTTQVVRRDGHWQVTGDVSSPRGSADRAIDVVVRLPFQPALWWTRISEVVDPVRGAREAKRAAETDLPPGAAVLETTIESGLAQDVLPIGCVTTPDQSSGVAMAIPPDFPCRFRFAYIPKEGCLELTLRFGLSAAAQAPFTNRAPFRFVIMPVDGRWGLRDAVRRYYELYPRVFARRTQASGLWLFAINSLKQVPDPQNYAFWEGPLPWKGRAEADSGDHEFWQVPGLRDSPPARPPGIGQFPYIIVGQREFTFLHSAATDYEDVLAVLERKPARAANPPGPREYWGGTWEEVKSLVENCGLHDERGRWQHILRNTRWGRNSISFPVNPSPFLPGQTVASTVLASVESQLKRFPGLAGIYVDSLASWGSYDNYRRDHFAAAQAPLSYGSNGRVCVPNWIPHLDFLRELRKRIDGRLVFGNGIRPGRAFSGFECDILGVETSHHDLKHRRNLDFYRTIGGAKPFLFLYFSEEDIPRATAEEYVQRFIAMGLSPEVKGDPWGVNKSRDADLLARFLPIYRRLDLAGWQPVPYAQLDSPTLWLERFGEKAKESYFTVYNPGPESVRVRLTVEWDKLGLPKSPELNELVEGKTVSAPYYEMTIPGRSLRVLQRAADSPRIREKS